MYLCPVKIFFNSLQEYNRSKIMNEKIHFNYAYPNHRYYDGYFRNMNVRGDIKNVSKLNLSNKMRMLWEQHVAWTRMLITSIAFDLPDTEFITNRLLRNPIDFEEALRSFYGDDIASQFRNLFREHLTIAAQLVKSAKAGDSQMVSNTEKEWYANADKIAAFLSDINPYWSQENWKSMLHEHLALTKSEAVNMLNKDYAANISVYDEIERQALEMADMMTEGIVEQFIKN
ncbi:acetylglutamate kinase [Clostridium luticellarii]|jgi:hypothetical protein|uniref:Acetylglutamate kinase n=1 Tax=Clostridium luticellarii TaxID=1691940 RepID=A0A2T0BDB5_9CLOT|nr:acetylglutamate kinase [Clostridium luticellarii]PRR81886.1 hypothetical protein CLLU_29840 [Clostridium luticellarii]